MPRRYRRRRTYSLARPVKTTKYSNETFIYNKSATFTAGVTTALYFIPSTNIMGTRKCKNFTLTLCCFPNAPFLFALVYVPEGTSPSNLNSSNEHPVSMYEPNQNVIMSGLFGGPYSATNRFKSRLARNLNSGDSIALLIASLATTETAQPVTAILNYAVAF